MSDEDAEAFVEAIHRLRARYGHTDRVTPEEVKQAKRDEAQQARNKTKKD
jgi:hypothetical protein